MLDLQRELAEALAALDLERLKVSKLRQAVCKLDRNAREWEDQDPERREVEGGGSPRGTRGQDGGGIMNRREWNRRERNRKLDKIDAILEPCFGPAFVLFIIAALMCI